MNLPLLIVLKRIGNGDKAWNELSEKVGEKLQYNSFTFNKAR